MSAFRKALVVLPVASALLASCVTRSAAQLTVTLNTVKKHSSHIYGKLGVRSRAQAIVQAQQLGLC